MEIMVHWSLITELTHMHSVLCYVRNKIELKYYREQTFCQFIVLQNIPIHMQSSCFKPGVTIVLEKHIIILWKSMLVVLHVLFHLLKYILKIPASHFFKAVLLLCCFVPSSWSLFKCTFQYNVKITGSYWKLFTISIQLWQCYWHVAIINLCTWKVPCICKDVWCLSWENCRIFCRKFELIPKTFASIWKNNIRHCFCDLKKHNTSNKI